MTTQETAATKEETPRAKWGDANIECKAHENEIRELLRLKWPLKVIWRKLQETQRISVKYHAFRTAVQKFDKKDIEVHDTEEKGTGQLPPLRSDPVPLQRTKKEAPHTPIKDNGESGAIVFNQGIETFKYDTD
jgi:hypothetical protein